MSFKDFINESNSANTDFKSAFKYADSYVFTKYGYVGGFDGDADEAMEEFGDDPVHSATVKFEVTTDEGKTGKITVHAGISQDGEVFVDDDEDYPITGLTKDIEAFIDKLIDKHGKTKVFDYLAGEIEDLEPTSEK